MILSRERERERNVISRIDGMKTSNKDLQQNSEKMVKSYRSETPNVLFAFNRSIRRHPTIYLQSVCSKNN